jgi:LmbE family N-acetylglucosaminyl deacetylase
VGRREAQALSGGLRSDRRLGPLGIPRGESEPAVAPMSGSMLRGLPRRAYRRSRALPELYRERRFRTRLRCDPHAPELLLSPHWDDAVLDCWSLLVSARDVAVVNLCAGIPAPGSLAPWDAITGATDSAARVRERIAEDARALARAGRTPVNLPFLDAQYRPAAPAPTLEEIDRALCAILPSTSRVHVPAGVGGHVDHLLARRYGRTLLRAGIPVTLHVDLPYCVLHGWPHWVDGTQADPHRNVDAFWMEFLKGVPELPPLRSAHVARLDDAAAAAKLKAMRCYETQFPGLDYGAGRLLSDPEIHRFEVSWELAPTASKGR